MSTPSGPVAAGDPGSDTNAINDAVRALASTMNKPAYDFDPSTIRKANVSQIDFGDENTPPTIAVYLSGDSTTEIAGVRLSDDYSPQIGDMVILIKQGAEFFAAFAIAQVGTRQKSSDGGGWTKAVLNSGHGHDGNSNGDLMYRRTLEDGCWKMQWKGGISYSAGTTTVLGTAVDATFRPSNKVSMTAARETASGGATGIGVDFTTGGNITVVGATWATNSSSTSHSHSHAHGVSVSVSGSGSGSGSTGGASAGTAHTHGVSTGDSFSGSGSGSTDTDSTSGGSSHSHTANSPSWISFHGLEYFL